MDTGGRLRRESEPPKLAAIQAYLEEEFPGYAIVHSEEVETGTHLIKLKNQKTYQLTIADDFLAERDPETIQNDLAIGRVAERVREAPGGRIMVSTDGIAVERAEAP